MHLNNPKAIPEPQSVEKLSSTKPVPGAKKIRDHSSTEYLFFSSFSVAEFSFVGTIIHLAKTKTFPHLVCGCYGYRTQFWPKK